MKKILLAAVVAATMSTAQAQIDCQPNGTDGQGGVYYSCQDNTDYGDYSVPNPDGAGEAIGYIVVGLLGMLFGG